jgi:hypothetical protein
MFNYFNKAIKKFSDSINYIEKTVNIRNNDKDIEENILTINNNFILWIEDNTFQDENYLEIFLKKYKNKIIIYNFLTRDINNKNNSITIKNINNYFGIYSFEFILNFSVEINEYLLKNKENFIIIHDNLKNNNIFLLLSIIISYVNKNLDNIIITYNNFLNLNQEVNKNNSNNENIKRYLGYFKNMQINKLENIKCVYLKNIIINGINQNFSIKILNNNEEIFIKENNKIQTNLFDINLFVNNDILIEIYYEDINYITIQFNIFFINENSFKIKKENINLNNNEFKIDNDFFINFIFDLDKINENNLFNDENLKIKKYLDKFNENIEIKKEEKIENKKENKIIENIIEIKDKIKSNSVINNFLTKIENFKQETINNIKNYDNKENKDNIKKNEDIDLNIDIKDNNEINKTNDEMEDEDVEKYIENLEKKSK